MAKLFLFISFLALVACSNTQIDEVENGTETMLDYTKWLEENGKAPEQFVIDLFQNHDVVFLGERHRVKHDVELVASLIRPLYEVGVKTMATEFGRREDQPLIDSLLFSSVWDEELAREIVFRQSISWGYQEYIDIYHSAWEMNHNLPISASRFRILGINDSPDWSLIRTDSDRENPEIMRKVWKGKGEADWAKVILDPVRKGEKVLAHSGIHHAFTEYRQPVVIDGKFSHFDHSPRCGNHVHAEIGKRAVTVFLHAPWNSSKGYGSDVRYPADGVIDSLMRKQDQRPIGFSVSEGPFAELRVIDAVYRHGYPQFKLADFCDGWIYTKPISEYEGVTPISAWINEGNIDQAREQSPNPLSRNRSINQFNRGIARATELNRRWGGLQ